MKVGIIGVIPRQEPDIRAIDYKAEIVFYDYAEYNKNNMESFSRKMDQIIFLSGHVPRNALHFCDQKKTKILHGNVGISSVIRYLDENIGRKDYASKPAAAPPISDTVKVVPTGKPAPIAAVTPAPPVVEEPVAEAPAPVDTSGDIGERQYDPLPKSWMGSMIGQTNPEYRIPTFNPITVRRSANGRYDHSILEASQVGDTLQYNRNTTETLNDTITRFTYVRSAYSARLTQMLEIHIFHTYVDVYVSSVEVPSKHALPRARYMTEREAIHAMMGVVDDLPTRPLVAAEPAEPETKQIKLGLKAGTLLKKVTVAEPEPAATTGIAAADAEPPAHRDPRDQTFLGAATVAKDESGGIPIRETFVHTVGAGVETEAADLSEQGEPRPGQAEDVFQVGAQYLNDAPAAKDQKVSERELVFWKELVLIQMRQGVSNINATIGADFVLQRMRELQKNGPQ